MRNFFVRVVVSLLQVRLLSEFFLGEEQSETLPCIKKVLRVQQTRMNFKRSQHRTLTAQHSNSFCEVKNCTTFREFWLDGFKTAYTVQQSIAFSKEFYPGC